MWSYTTLLICLLNLTGGNTSVIDNLISIVFSGYNVDIRPQCEANDTTEVELFMALRQIVNIDEPNQFMEVNIWMQMKWVDCKLSWNPMEYANISSFIIPYGNVWVPDLTLYDNAKPVLAGFEDFRATVYHDGNVSYNFPSFVTSVCILNIKYFPFDHQSCTLTLGSWVYNGWEIDVTFPADKIDTISYLGNSEWELKDTSISRLNNMFDGVPYPTLQFKIKIQRRPLFYIFNVIFPCLLITLVAMLGFLLPPDSGEKISLQVTVLLSLAIFQLVILDLIPSSGDSFPLISSYFTFSMLIVALSCFLTVVVLRIHFKGKHSHQLDGAVRKYILIPLAKLTFIDLRKYSLSPDIPQVDNDAFHSPSVIQNHKDSAQSGIYDDDNQVNQSSHVLTLLSEILVHLQRINDTFNTRRGQKEISTWWRVLSQAFDRLFLFIYILSTIAIAVVLLGPSTFNDENA